MFVSGSSYKSSSWPIQMNIKVDGNLKGSLKTYCVSPNEHKNYPPKMLVLTDVDAGTRQLTLEAESGTNSNVNDYYNVTIMEFPF